jgi:acetaldehyde dehydrogenase (acetylating)
MRRMVGLAVVGALALGACGGGGDKPEVAALKREFAFIGDGQWGRLYDMLHPAQQALVTRDQFITCSAKTSQPAISVGSVKEIFDEVVDVPGTPLHVPSRAVTFEAHSGGAKDVVTQHVVDIDGTWRWILNDPTQVESC